VIIRDIELRIGSVDVVKLLVTDDRVEIQQAHSDAPDDYETVAETTRVEFVQELRNLMEALT